MIKFKYFLLTAITFFIFSNQINAFTKTSIYCTDNKQIDYTSPLITDDIITSSHPLANESELKEAQFVSAKSTDLIANNLTLLYSICFALVLFNLAAQIKIIFQMVHLFFQFKKKDEFAGFNFQ